jgi:hypothetical protein
MKPILFAFAFAATLAALGRAEIGLEAAPFVGDVASGRTQAAI